MKITIGTPQGCTITNNVQVITITGVTANAGVLVPAVEASKVLAGKSDGSGLEYISLPGGGDMLKSVYDADDDGMIDLVDGGSLHL